MDRRRGPAVIALAIAGTALGAGGTSPADAAPRSATVTLQNIAFNPASVTVRRGGVVTFVWRDGDTPHNVTPTGRPKFRRQATRTAGQATMRFARPGTYRFVCTIHPGMAGKVVVR